MKKYRYNIIKFVTIDLIAFGLAWLYALHPFPKDKLFLIQTNLITVSGILTGIVIAYLAAKQFQIIQRRQNIYKDVVELSDKLTNFRKLLFRITKSYEFWGDHDDIKKFERKYPGLTFTDLHAHGKNDKKEEVRKFHSDEEISHTRADLHAAMKEIIGHTLSDSWVYDRLSKYSYPLDYLERSLMPFNQIWYYMVGKYEKHTDGLINDKGIPGMYKDDVRELVSQIDPKYKNKDFDRHVLGELSTEFHEIHIPKLIQGTTIIQKGLSKSTKNLLITLIIILCTGVMVPLSIQTLDIDEQTAKLITFGMVVIVICSLTSFIFDFCRMMIREVKLKE